MSGTREGRARTLLRVVAGLTLVAGVVAALLVLGLRGATAQSIQSQSALVTTRERPSASERAFSSRDSLTLMGLQLYVRSRGTVVIVHGLGEADSLFTHWAGALGVATGMNVIGLSLRGNGRSRDTVSHAGGADAYASDVATVIRELKRRSPSGPVLLLATHGGLGITAHTVSAYARMESPRADGIIALDAALGDESRVANGRQLVVYPRRVRIIAALSSAGIHWLDGRAVAEQSSTTGVLHTRWSFAEWDASAPQLGNLLTALEANATPLLVISNAPPVMSASTGDSLARTWVQVRGAVDPNSDEVASAITRWTSIFSANAFEPIPPKATQTLDVLGIGRPGAADSSRRP
jgi:hypothetical protein